MEARGEKSGPSTSLAACEVPEYWRITHFVLYLRMAAGKCQISSDQHLTALIGKLLEKILMDGMYTFRKAGTDQ